MRGVQIGLAMRRFPASRFFSQGDHLRALWIAQICGAHFDIESGISRLLEGPRRCPLEGVVYGYGAGICAKHSAQLQAVVEIFVRTCKTVCRHTSLHVRTKI